MQVLNRITVADIVRGAKIPKVETDKEGNPVMQNGKPKIIVGDDGKPVMTGLDHRTRPQDVFLIIGKARETKAGTTQYGNYLEYYGVYEATRFCDGEKFQSGRTIFPPPTDAVVENKYMAAKAADVNAEVGFAYIIGTEEHTHAGETKFRWTCKPLELGDEEQSDPLAEIKAQIEAQIVALLPAPAKAIEAPKADAKEKA